MLPTICCRATTKTETAWSSCTISNSRIVFVSKTRYKWQLFWFVFNLKSLSRCYVQFFFFLKTGFVLVYSIAWNWFLLTTITIQNIPRIKCGFTKLCKCIRVFNAIKSFVKEMRALILSPLIVERSNNTKVCLQLQLLANYV